MCDYVISYDRKGFFQCDPFNELESGRLFQITKGDTLLNPEEKNYKMESQTEGRRYSGGCGTWRDMFQAKAEAALEAGYRPALTVSLVSWDSF